MHIAVRYLYHFVGFAGVNRAIHARVEHVDRIGVLRIGLDMGVIPGPLTKFVLLIDPPPGFAGIV